MAENGLPHLLFEAGNSRYLIGINELVEIVPAGDISRLPGSAENVLGLTNYRGEVIGILQIPGALAENSTAQNRIIVLKYKKEKVGIPASKVHEVANIPAEAVKTGYAEFKKQRVKIIKPADLFTQPASGGSK